MAKVIFIVDGEFMRKHIIKTKSFYFDGNGIRSHCLKHLKRDDELVRIMYYDALPFVGKGENPISGPIDFATTPMVAKKQKFLQSLRNTPNIHLRLGRSAMQSSAWYLDPQKLGELLACEVKPEDIKASDLYPDIRQKGVDVMVGLDVAAIAYQKLADKIVIVANDSDYIPAVKMAREAGLLVVLDPLWTRAAEDLRENVDYVYNAMPRIENGYDDHKDVGPFKLEKEMTAKIIEK